MIEPGKYLPICVHLINIFNGNKKIRLPDLVQEIMLNPKHSPKESRSNNFQEKKNGSRGIQPNLIARVKQYFLLLLIPTFQKIFKNMVKSRIAMFERKQSLPN